MKHFKTLQPSETFILTYWLWILGEVMSRREQI